MDSYISKSSSQSISQYSSQYSSLCSLLSISLSIATNYPAYVVDFIIYSETQRKNIIKDAKLEKNITNISQILNDSWKGLTYDNNIEFFNVYDMKNKYDNFSIIEIQSEIEKSLMNLNHDFKNSVSFLQNCVCWLHRMLEIYINGDDAIKEKIYTMLTKVDQS